jgi:hypothetical protein
MKNKVVFRKFNDGQVIALFPELPCDDRGNITSYMHIGQHAPASRFIVHDTKPAKPEEYAALHAELLRIGYDIEIRKKLNIKSA